VAIKSKYLRHISFFDNFYENSFYRKKQKKIIIIHDVQSLLNTEYDNLKFKALNDTRW